MKRYEGPYSARNGAYGGVDDLGRVLTTDNTIPLPRKNRSVGMFYYLAPGNHGLRGPYDNNKIVTSHPEAIESEEAWMAAGGGERHADHHFAEPLFGYYTMNDAWVVRKHVQMLTDAGVDYLVFDTTNAVTYDGTVKILLGILDEFYKQGITNVPKVAYYTNALSGRTINHIYHNIYRKYPEYGHLWFYWDGRPLIIGHPDDPGTGRRSKSLLPYQNQLLADQPEKQRRSVAVGGVRRNLHARRRLRRERPQGSRQRIVGAALRYHIQRQRLVRGIEPHQELPAGPRRKRSRGGCRVMGI